jgi:hypothetical protein
MLVGVVEKHDVNGVHTESLEACFEGPDDAVTTEIPNASMGCWNVEALIVAFPSVARGLKESTNFR